LAERIPPKREVDQRDKLTSESEESIMPGFSFGELRKEYETLRSSMKIPPGLVADVDKVVRGIV